MGISTPKAVMRIRQSNSYKELVTELNSINIRPLGEDLNWGQGYELQAWKLKPREHIHVCERLK